jgi:hypothetical protein
VQELDRDDDSKKSHPDLELTAVDDRASDQAFVLGPVFKRRSHLFGALQSAADIFIFRTDVERD